MMGIYWENDAEDGTGRNSETGNGKGIKGDLWMW